MVKGENLVVEQRREAHHQHVHANADIRPIANPITTKGAVDMTTAAMSRRNSLRLVVIW